ncbi:hypothetical protein [Streptomyces decoyicus]|uniref:hypothetical protein n=1 Tax=Streptomyces decoyicus TaxID=249567 RepID=UPI003648CA82
MFPSDGDRIALTRTGRDGLTRSYIGTATEVTPYGRSTIDGLWVGGWRLTGHDLSTGEAADSYFACTQTLERYDSGIRQSVRLACAEDE